VLTLLLARLRDKNSFTVSGFGFRHQALGIINIEIFLMSKYSKRREWLQFPYQNAYNL